MKQGKRDQRIERIKAVEREYLVAVEAINLLVTSLKRDPSLLKSASVGHTDLRNLAENLQATFLIRLFAEFETGLREAWIHAFHRNPETRVRDMITSVGARCDVPEKVQMNVQAVRKYRNSLVHADDSDTQPLALNLARSYLCTFFSRLPETW